MALWFAAIFAPVQILIGDLHGLGVLKYQPTKLAAIEGNWDRQANMPLRLFAIPDEEAETNHYEIAIPKIGSWILTHAYDGVVPGLKDVPPDERPPVWPVFFSFRVMVGIGFAMLGLEPMEPLSALERDASSRTAGSCVPRWSMTPSGFGAVLFGWFTAEIGRQPYVVYGQPAHRRRRIARHRRRGHGSLIAFVVVYAFVFGFGSLLPRQAAAQGARAGRGAARPRSRRPPRPPVEAAALGAGRRPRRRSAGRSRS